MLNGHLLAVLIWLPIAGGFVVLGLGERVALAKWLSLAVSALTLLFSVPLYTAFKTGTADMQFVERTSWIRAIHADYYTGVDGISMPLILLTTFTTVLIVIAGWSNIEKRIAQYFAAFLILEGLMIGVFAALDAALFYVFWEAMLLPMFIIIGVWGGPRRVYATIKFFLYTFLGSLLMLVALIYLYLKAGTYELAVFQGMPLTLTEQTFIFLAFFAAFAVKVPMWPVHTWLPDAHVEAPTGGSVVLGGDHAQDGRVRLPALLPADRARREPRAGLADHRPVADRGGVHRIRGPGAARHEEIDRVFVDRAHGLRHAGDVHRLPDRVAHRQNHRHRARTGRRRGANAVARPGIGRDVPVRRASCTTACTAAKSAPTAAW